MRIKNINGTSQNKCRCGSWLDHWKNYSKQSVPIICPAYGCNGKDIVGAHVQKDSIYDNKWYIYPLCTSCNQKGGTLDVSDLYKLVSANVSETCG